MDCEHRLYRLGIHRYIHHDGVAPLPPEIREYCLTSRGEPPPYIPLPREPVVFLIGVEGAHKRKVAWNGNGALPDDVLDHVREHGTLPPYNI